MLYFILDIWVYITQVVQELPHICVSRCQITNLSSTVVWCPIYMCFQVPLTLLWLAWQPFWLATNWSHLAHKPPPFIACWLSLTDQPVRMKAFCHRKHQEPLEQWPESTTRVLWELHVSQGLPIWSEQASICLYSKILTKIIHELEFCTYKSPVKLAQYLMCG
jgi:hypothetical protein